MRHKLTPRRVGEAAAGGQCSVVSICNTSTLDLSLASDAIASDGPKYAVLCWLLTAEQPVLVPQCWSLSAVDEVVIGRGADFAVRVQGRQLTIRLRDSFLSKEHARLWRCPSGWAIGDAGSKNGTLVNSAGCTRGTLRHGDIIEIGATFLQFTEATGTPPLGDDAVLASFTPTVRAIDAKLAAIAPSRVPVLVLGETGVGKELAARTIHDRSRRSGAFVGVNSAALPSTLLEAALFGHRRGAFTGAIDSRAGLLRSAHGGTLFLDEIGELPLSAQAALLRVLQEHEVVAVGDTEPIAIDVRIVAATNRDLVREVSHGRFRDDLLARLAGLTLRLVPLRERRSDLGLLLHSLIVKHAPQPERVVLSLPAARALVAYDWPRNIRELELCLQSAGQLARWSRIKVRHLPEALVESRGGAVMHNELVALLETHRGNVTAVARELKTSRMQVHRLLKQSMLDPSDFRE